MPSENSNWPCTVTERGKEHKLVDAAALVTGTLVYLYGKPCIRAPHCVVALDGSYWGDINATKFMVEVAPAGTSFTVTAR